MGSAASRHRLLPCLGAAAPGAGAGGSLAGAHNPVFEPDPLDEALGHSFCYVRSATPAHSRSSSAADPGGAPAYGSAAETAFKAISGAAVSANSTTLPLYAAAAGPSHPAGFRSSSSFSALPLQLAGGGGGGAASGPLDGRYFLSGPIESGSMSGPLDSVPFSGPIVKKRRRGLAGRLRRPSMLRRSISEKKRPWVVPVRGFDSRRRDGDGEADGDVQWAHGSAGEDRVHVVVSEEHRWLFVGIYDGFNGPEAPEFLVGNLYRNVFGELRDLFWEEGGDEGREDSRVGKRLWEFLAEGDGDKELDLSGSGRFAFSLSKLRYGIGSWRKDGRGMWLPKWRYDFEERGKEVREAVDRGGSRRRRKKGPVEDHGLVLGALSRALEDTEAAYLEMTDKVLDCNPELALMGSCLLVVLMRDDDVYVMNVGDSRAIVAQYVPRGFRDGSWDQEPGMVLEKGGIGGVERGDGGDESCFEIEGLGQGDGRLGALQLSTDHSTSIAEVSLL